MKVNSVVFVDEQDEEKVLLGPGWEGPLPRTGWLMTLNVNHVATYWEVLRGRVEATVFREGGAGELVAGGAERSGYARIVIPLRRLPDDDARPRRLLPMTTQRAHLRMQEELLAQLRSFSAAPARDATGWRWVASTLKIVDDYIRRR